MERPRRVGRSILLDDALGNVDACVRAAISPDPEEQVSATDVHNMIDDACVLLHDAVPPCIIRGEVDRDEGARTGATSLVM